jgi:Fe-S cluster assembly protein SufD
VSEAAPTARERWLEKAEAVPPVPTLTALRRAGREALGASGFPDAKQEEWRYTNPKDLLAIDFERATEGVAQLSRERVEALATPVYACGLAVYVNGHAHPELSGVRIGDVEVTRLAEAEAAGPGSLLDAKAHPFAALNAAMLDDGIVIRIPDGAQPEHPVHVVFASTSGSGAPQASHPRVYVEAGAGSRAIVVQDHVSLGSEGHFTNAVTEVSVGANASLELVTLQRENDATWHVSNLVVRQERDARFASHVVTLGGRFVRNDLSALLAGEGAHCRMNGLYLGTGESLIDNHTHVDHAVPHGTSDQLYKGVLVDDSRGVFRGRVLVRPDAQKTDAQQSNPNLLLSDGAEIDTKPQLEIRADDVKCSHGATIGGIDPDALFYLQARGIDAADARVLLTRGFAAEVLGALPDEALAEALGSVFAERIDTEGRA